MLVPQNLRIQTSGFQEHRVLRPKSGVEGAGVLGSCFAAYLSSMARLTSLKAGLMLELLQGGWNCGFGLHV